MARNKVDECMFCGFAPCACNKPAKPVATTKEVKAPQPKAPRANLPTTHNPGISPSPVAPPIREVRQAGVPGLPAASAPKTLHVKQYRSTEEEQWRRAITLIATVLGLSEADLVKHRDSLDLPDWKIEALIWRSQA